MFHMPKDQILAVRGMVHKVQNVSASRLLQMCEQGQKKTRLYRYIQPLNAFKFILFYGLSKLSFRWWLFSTLKFISWRKCIK